MGGIGDGPQPVDQPFAVGEFRFRLALLDQGENVQGFALSAVVHIKGIDVAEIAAGGLHKIQAVFLGLGERFFVGQHDALGKFLQLHLADKPRNGSPPAVQSADIAAALQAVFDLIDIEGRLLVPAPGCLFPPIPEGCGPLRRKDPPRHGAVPDG